LGIRYLDTYLKEGQVRTYLNAGCSGRYLNSWQITGGYLSICSYLYSNSRYNTPAP
jgi:hypothetical protein